MNKKNFLILLDAVLWFIQDHLMYTGLIVVGKRIGQQTELSFMYLGKSIYYEYCRICKIDIVTVRRSRVRCRKFSCYRSDKRG